MITQDFTLFTILLSVLFNRFKIEKHIYLLENIVSLIFNKTLNKIKIDEICDFKCKRYDLVHKQVVKDEIK